MNLQRTTGIRAFCVGVYRHLTTRTASVQGRPFSMRSSQNASIPLARAMHEAMAFKGIDNIRSAWMQKAVSGSYPKVPKPQSLKLSGSNMRCTVGPSKITNIIVPTF